MAVWKWTESPRIVLDSPGRRFSHHDFGLYRRRTMRNDHLLVPRAGFARLGLDDLNGRTRKIPLHSMRRIRFYRDISRRGRRFPVFPQVESSQWNRSL